MKTPYAKWNNGISYPILIKKFWFFLFLIVLPLISCKKEEQKPTTNPGNLIQVVGVIVDDCSLLPIEEVRINFQFYCSSFFGGDPIEFTTTTSNQDGKFSSPTWSCCDLCASNVVIEMVEYPNEYNLKKLGLNSVNLAGISLDSLELKPLTELIIIAEPDSLLNQSTADSIHLNLNIIKGFTDDSDIWHFRSKEVGPFLHDGGIIRFGWRLQSLQNAEHKIILFYTRDGIQLTKEEVFTSECNDSNEITIIY